jgi:hypothetical protein
MLALIGIPLEVLSVSYTVNILAQFWVHTKLKKQEFKYIDKVLMTPSQHRVHHGSNDIYRNKNFGAAFSIWDRLFNSFQPETEEVTYGVTSYDNSYNPLWSNIQPLIILSKQTLIALKGGYLFKFMIGKEKVRLDSINQYSDLAEESHSVFTFTYVTVQFAFLIYLTLQVVYGELNVLKLFLVPYILISFGVLGLLYDKKVMGFNLERQRILSLIFVLIFLNSFIPLSLLILTTLIFTLNGYQVYAKTSHN